MLKESFLSKEYMVSNEGYVLSKIKGTPLKPSINHKGYQIVNLMINGERIGVAVHTLVARAFCDGYKEGLTVNHKDGDKSNNNANNLEWVTSKENIIHSIEVLGKDHTGSSNGNAKAIIGYDKTTGEKKYEFDSLIDAAKYLEPNADYKRLRVIQNCISSVINGRKKSYRSIIWKI